MRNFILLCFLFGLTCLSSCDNNSKSTELSKNEKIAFDSLKNQLSTLFDNALKTESIHPEAAKKIYQTIYTADSLNYWGKQAESRLRYLTASAAKHDMMKKLADTWVWDWKGTNWGEIEIPAKGSLERKLVLKANGEIEFYQNDTLIQKDIFELRAPNEFMRDKYLLELKNSKQIFAIFYDRSRLELSQPDCVCGCLTNIYFRKWRSGI